MNKFPPSLFGIYKQTRAQEKEDPKNPQRKQQQRERVAVAIVALVLQHDPDFRTAFLQKICEFGIITPEDWGVSLEISGCGDMSLDSHGAIAICEFKIDSPLKDIQCPDFKGGYRDNIDRLYSQIPERRYIIVQKKPAQQSSNRALFKDWHDILAATRSSTSSWVRDLSESLAMLDIPAFSYERTSQMKLVQNAIPAAHVHALLKNIADGKFRFKTQVDASGVDAADEDSYFGFSVLTRGLAYIKTQLDNNQNQLAFYGYEGKKLSVWFYTGAKATAIIKEKLEKLWPHNVLVEETNVGVRIDSDQVTSDQDFFEKSLSLVFRPDNSDTKAPPDDGSFAKFLDTISFDVEPTEKERAQTRKDDEDEEEE